MSIRLNDEHRDTAQLCGSIIQMTRLLDLGLLADIVRYGREYDNVGSILDSSNWMTQHPKNQQDTEIYAAVLKFKETLNEIERVHNG